MASLVLAYIFWLTGGLFGLHHLYLRRDSHAFVSWCTFGGVFGLGWIRDLFRLPTYVNDANDDPEYFEQLRISMKHRKKPSSSSARFLGEMVVGSLFGFIVKYSVPEELSTEIQLLITAITPCAVALGVYVVGNIGREKTSYKSSLIGAYITLPIFIFFYQFDFTTMSLICALITNWKGKEWRRTPYTKRRISTRITILSFCAIVYLSLWSSMLYHNASVTTTDGKTIKLKDAIQYFFKSPMWTELKDTLKQLYQFYTTHGFDRLWEEFVKSIDPEGEANAYKVLELSSTATQKEITERYRKLARTWHPDRHRDPIKKDEAARKFMEIQEAYEILSLIKTKRKSKNQQKRDKEENS
ncbi:dnaJ homolog subfamily C member 22-like [Tubulanus polymorphus]|uniref:dnaJ homolog subfamily C member 22-like n=1 Tax=Tubulanus polymorphus TaxID=672921 RepID=UPI003DA5176F